MGRKWGVVILLGIVLWAFHRVPYGELVLLDDDLHLTQNPHVSAPLETGLVAIWSRPYQGLYIPVTYSYWAVGRRVLERYWETWKQGTVSRQGLSTLFHTGNLILHGANALLVFALLGALGLGSIAALGGAALFALHPVQVEPVAWVSGAKDLLSTFFSLGALNLFFRGWQGGKGALPLGTVLYVLALLSKPGAVVVPVLAAALVFFSGQVRAFPWRWLLLWGVLALPLAWVTTLQQPSFHLTHTPSAWERPFIASDAFTFYLSKLLLPLRLAPDYGRHPLALEGSVWKYVTWLVPVLGGLLLLRRGPLVRGVFSWLVVALLPVLGFIPFYFQEYSTVADRYLYLALVGPALGFGFLVQRGGARRGVGAVSLLGLLGYLSAVQVGHWRNSETLFLQTIRVNPDSLLAHNNLGTLYEEQGKVPEAAFHYLEVLRIDPENLVGQYNMGRLMARLGKWDEAQRYYEGALRKNFRVPDAHYALAVLALQKGKEAEAIERLEWVLRLRPGDAAALVRLGRLAQGRGEWDRALQYYEAALTTHPLHSEAQFGLGECLRRKGDLRGARRAFALASHGSPDWPAPREAMAALGFEPEKEKAP